MTRETGSHTRAKAANLLTTTIDIHNTVSTATLGHRFMFL